MEAARGEFPRELLRDMAAQGLLGLDIPAEYGGQGLNALSCCVILEELAAGWFSATSYAAAMSAGPILEAGTEAQKLCALQEAENDLLAEIECNPVLVTAGGLVAVDAVAIGG